MQKSYGQGTLSPPPPLPHFPTSTCAVTSPLTLAAAPLAMCCTCAVVGCSDGRSRQFGFVGYAAAAEAHDAIRYFNKSFIGTFRLVVEVLLC